MKYYYCDYITSVNGARALTLEKKLLPFVKQLLYHKLVSQEDIEDMVGIIDEQQQMFRRECPRLRSLDVFSADSNLPEYEHKFIRFGSCFARLEPVQGLADTRDIPKSRASEIFNDGWWNCLESCSDYLPDPDLTSVLEEAGVSSAEAFVRAETAQNRGFARRIELFGRKKSIQG